MHFFDNTNCERPSDSFFSSDVRQRFGIFEALGLKACTDEVFAFEADFLSEDIWLTDIRTGQGKTLPLQDIFVKIHDEDAQALRASLSYISSYERRQIDVSARILYQGFYMSFRIKGFAFQREDRVFAVGIAYGSHLTETLYSRLEYLENHDALTGLANASALDAFVSDARNMSVGAQTLIIAKIDKFNEINDSFGYAAGNLLIKNVAEVIRDCFFDAEMVARIGGGEFCALYMGKSQLEIDNKIKQARMTLLGMYMNLVKTEVSFGYAAVSSAADFCDLYRQALQNMRKNRDMRVMLTETTLIDSLSSMIDRKAGWGKRTVRVQSLAAQVADSLGCCEECVMETKVLAKIADVGLIGVSDALLQRRHALSEEEQEAYQRHVEYGRDIIAGIGELASFQERYLDIFKRYDEWRESLALSSRIIAAVRGFDDIVSSGNGVKPGDIRERFISKRGTQYCPRVVDAIVRIAGRYYYTDGGHTGCA